MHEKGNLRSLVRVQEKRQSPRDAAFPLTMVIDVVHVAVDATRLRGSYLLRDGNPNFPTDHVSDDWIKVVMLCAKTEHLSSER